MLEMRDLERALFGAPGDEKAVMSFGRAQDDGSRKREPLRVDEIEQLLQGRYQHGYGEGHTAGFSSAEEIFRAQADRDVSNAVRGTLEFVLEALQPAYEAAMRASVAVQKAPRARTTGAAVLEAAKRADSVRDSLAGLRDAVADNGIRQP